MTLEEWFRGILDRYPRVALTGGPSVGKTTLSLKMLDRPILHSDHFKHLDWSTASAEMAKQANLYTGTLLVEGVAVPRALRKGMKVDVVVVLREPRIKQTPGQLTMTRGLFTVLDEWRKANPNVPIISPPKDVSI